MATNDFYYLRKDDAEAQDILMLINTGADINDKERLHAGGDFSIRSAEDMAETFKDNPEAIENTQKIAEACNLELKLEEIPNFPISTFQIIRRRKHT